MQTQTLVIFDRIIEYGIIFLIVFTPFAFGSVHLWAYSAVELIICFLVIIWILKLISINISKAIIMPYHQLAVHNPQFTTSYSTVCVNRFGFVKTPLNTPIILFVGLILFQLMPLPPGALKFFSPNTYQLYKATLTDGQTSPTVVQAHEITNLTDVAVPAGTSSGRLADHPLARTESGGSQITNNKSSIVNRKSQISNFSWRPISIYPYATKSELIKILTYIGLFFLITNVPGVRINHIVVIIIGVGFLISFLGILQKLTGTTKIYWVGDASYVDLFGPYINRNHFAGYIVMVIPIALGLLISRFANITFSRNMTWRSIIVESESHIFVNLLLIFAMTIMISSLFLSLSRGGIISFIVVMVVFFSLVGLSRAKEAISKGRRIILTVLILAFVFLIWLGLNPVLNRLSSLSSPERYEVFQNTINIAKDFPLFGTGLGTFQYIYPRYKSLQDQLYYDHAHNDYVELLSENGVLGLVIVMVGIIVFFGKTVAKWRERRDTYAKGITLGGICGVIAIFNHSFTDFNLHIPANALFFSLILGLTFNAVHLKSIRTKG
jgi:O-antigen ligase